MLFFTCETKGLPRNESENENEKRGSSARADSRYAAELGAMAEDFNQQNTDKYYGFICKASNDKLQICFAAYDSVIPADKVKEFLALLPGDPDASFTLKEITMKSFAGFAGEASRRNFIDDSNDVYYALDIDDISHGRRNSSFAERVITKNVSKAQLIKRANAVMCGETLAPELERIYAGGSSTVKGHPVHYMIQSDNRKVTEEIVEILVAALVANNRLVSRRYVSCKFNWDNSVDAEYRCLCKSAYGGAMVTTCDSKDSDDNEYASQGADIIIDVAEIARKSRNSLLTILCLPRKCDRMSELFLENIGEISFVTIHEEAAFEETAKDYLRSLAKQAGARPDIALYKAVEPGKGYLANDLELAFEKWFDRYLKTRVYKQYKVLETGNAHVAKAKPKGSAFSELNEMIGLSSAKEVIAQAIDFYKAQKLFSDMGIDKDRPAMHMVFTGNPGTAKTTAARLFARIMKDNGLLSVGDLREVGRADLVDRYVGGTAPRVKNCFKKAKGSVLFIDEAYSLVDDRDGLFGDEAINTIVQEMENARDDMVVIFAGYPDKMEGFLNKNPGLRSRIAFHINFDDYCADELCGILELMVKNHKMDLSGGVIEKLRPVFESAAVTPDFGNGRFVRNLFEKAKLKQASRLVKMDVGVVVKADIITLISDDFDAAAPAPPQTRRIGF